MNGQDAFGVTVNNSATSNHMVITSPGIAVQKLVNGQVATTAPGPIITVGSPVTFTYTVTNTGNDPLQGVTLTDNNGTPSNSADDFHPTFTGGDTNGNGLLDIGETWTYTASAAALAGQYENTARVTATDVCNIPVSASALGHYFGITPGIAITKTTQGPPVSVVDLRRFGYHHRPTSLVLTFSGPLDPATAGNPANYQLSTAGRDRQFGTPDDQLVPLSSAIYDPATRTVTLTPQQRFLYLFQTYLLQVNSTTPGGVTDLSGNLIDGNGDGQPGGNFFTVFGPNSLRLANAPTLPQPEASVPAGALGPAVTIGNPVTFTYAVRNTGDTPLSNVTVIDNAGTPSNPADDFAATYVSGDSNGNGLLDMGEIWNYTSTRTATMVGQYQNIATVTGRTPNGSQVTGVAVSNYFGVCPSVVDLVRRGVHHQPAQVVLTFNAPLNATSAQNLSNYSLVASGHDQKFGTADDQPIPLQSAVYDPLQQTVTLTASRPLNVHGLYQVTANGFCPTGTPFVGVLNRKYSLALELQGRGQPTTGKPLSPKVPGQFATRHQATPPSGPHALMASTPQVRRSFTRR